MILNKKNYIINWGSFHIKKFARLFSRNNSYAYQLPLKSTTGNLLAETKHLGGLKNLSAIFLY